MKPKTNPSSPFPPDPESLHREDDWLWLPLKSEWRNVASKPEEVVRQRFIRRLHEGYGYSLLQMAQERKTQAGTRSPRADILVWETSAAMSANASPVVVVECKSEAVGISLKDYFQGESYARAVGAEMFVAHNARYTTVFEVVPKAPGEFVELADLPKASDWGDAKKLAELKARQRAFNRKQFQDLLFECHSILRDRHKMDPGTAFDTISKILFVKMYVERSGQHGAFTRAFIDKRRSTLLSTDRPVHEGLFDSTKAFYSADALFGENERLAISESTFRDIVGKLERFDLSKTSDDVKGLAFERFLGATFRGELGQYFTPRSVVEFMIDVLNPGEGERVCDPAAGSGGFLIRAFEHVRQEIIDDVQAEKDARRAAIEAEGGDAKAQAARIDEAFTTLNEELVPTGDDNQPIDTRVGRLAWRCIYGSDAEPRAARTAKMNMIMHGDGHGGIHFHDGLVDINGIFPERFDVVVTNPPFGSTVGRDQRVGGTEQARISADAGYVARGVERYGPAWKARHDRMLAEQSGSTPILDLFEIGRDKAARETEVVFVERCLELLRPGGRLGIILPDGNLNNPSLTWLRRWCEGRARIAAVVSLPEETFRSSAAAVKASVVFMERFTAEDEAAWETAWTAAHTALDADFAARRDAAAAEHDAAHVQAWGKRAAAGFESFTETGGVRTPFGWEQGQAPAYPRGIGSTRPLSPKWRHPVRDPRRTVLAKAILGEALADATSGEAEARRALAAALKRIDAEHQAALWAHVRAAFDYPVFVAAPRAVGITSTGETGPGAPNDLPAVLEAWRIFDAWRRAGAPEAETPGFPLPSAA